MFIKQWNHFLLRKGQTNPTPIPLHSLKRFKCNISLLIALVHFYLGLGWDDCIIDILLQLCVTLSKLPYDQMKDWIDEMTLTLLFNSIQIQSEIKWRVKFSEQGKENSWNRMLLRWMMICTSTSVSVVPLEGKVLFFFCLVCLSILISVIENLLLSDRTSDQKLEMLRIIIAVKNPSISLIEFLSWPCCFRSAQ